MGKVNLVLSLFLHTRLLNTFSDMIFLLAVSLLSLSLLRGSLALRTDDSSGYTTQHLPQHEGVSVSFKQANICQSDTDKAWAGYVHMPSSFIKDIESAEPYNLSMFFLYFESRNDPREAPTAMFLAGGPGAPSTGDGMTNVCAFHTQV